MEWPYHSFGCVLFYHLSQEGSFARLNSIIFRGTCQASLTGVFPGAKPYCSWFICLDYFTSNVLLFSVLKRQQKCPQLGILSLIGDLMSQIVDILPKSSYRQDTLGTNQERSSVFKSKQLACHSVIFQNPEQLDGGKLSFSFLLLKEQRIGRGIADMVTMNLGPRYAL